MDKNLIFEIEKQLKTDWGLNITTEKVAPVYGGCIHEAYLLHDRTKNYFIKLQQSSSDMLSKEVLGLKRLYNKSGFKIPKIFGHGQFSNDGATGSYLCLEYIEPGEKNKNYWELAGQSLATLHQNQGVFFGLDHNNYIGSLQQTNAQKKDWCDFYIQERIEPLLRKALDLGRLTSADAKSFETLYQRLNSIFPKTKPSLLHGDLWSGNTLANRVGQPYIFDPAVYYGHPEMELAFTYLFGGFDPLFYDSYDHCTPLPPGFKNRMGVYNLYPLLVHLLLFGNQYHTPIKQTLKQFT